MTSRHLSIVACSLALTLVSPVAHADRWAALDKATHDSSWRVRLQAASVLGKLHGPRCIALLQRLARDDQATVRRAAAVQLERVRAGETTVQATPPPPPARNKDVTVLIGGVGAKAKSVPPGMTDKLRSLLQREFAHTPALVVNGEPVSGYRIDGSIVTLDHKTTRDWMEITCEVSVIVGRLPSKAVVMMTSGGATLQEPRASYRADRTASLDADALEGAVKGAHDNVLAYLRTH